MVRFYSDNSLMKELGSLRVKLLFFYNNKSGLVESKIWGAVALLSQTLLNLIPSYLSCP